MFKYLEKYGKYGKMFQTEIVWPEGAINDKII